LLTVEHKLNHLLILTFCSMLLLYVNNWNNWLKRGHLRAYLGIGFSLLTIWYT